MPRKYGLTPRSTSGLRSPQPPSPSKYGKKPHTAYSPIASSSKFFSSVNSWLPSSSTDRLFLFTVIIACIVLSWLFLVFMRASPVDSGSHFTNIGQTGSIDVSAATKRIKLTLFTLMQHIGDDVFLTDRGRFVHQWNAMHSWVRMNDFPVHGDTFYEVEVLAFVSDDFSCDYIHKNFPKSVRCFTETACSHPELKRTMINCIWQTAQNIAVDTDLLMYINADIILLEDMLPAIHSSRTTFGDGQFLMVGRRVDVLDRKDKLIDFDDVLWREKCRSAATNNGTLHGEYGLDYWVHYKSSIVFDNETYHVDKVYFPDFLAGVFRWDNHLLSHFIRNAFIHVIDGSKTVLAIHQDDIGNIKHFNRFGAGYNAKLTSKISSSQYHYGNVLFSDTILSGDCRINNCTFSPNTVRDPMPIMLTRRMNRKFHLGMLFVHQGVIQSAQNWLCWANRVGFRNFIAVPVDKASQKMVKDMESKGMFLGEFIGRGWLPESLPQFNTYSSAFDAILKYMDTIFTQMNYYGVGFTIFSPWVTPIAHPLDSLSRYAEIGEFKMGAIYDTKNRTVLSLTLPTPHLKWFKTEVLACIKTLAGKPEGETLPPEELPFWDALHICLWKLKPNQPISDPRRFGIYPVAEVLENKFHSPPSLMVTEPSYSAELLEESFGPLWSLNSKQCQVAPVHELDVNVTNYTGIKTTLF
jgi:hypothetical protein